MLRFVKIAAAVATILFGGLWLLSTVASGFSVPDWIPAACGCSAGVYVIIDVLGH